MAPAKAAAPGDSRGSSIADRIRGLTPYRGAAPCVIAGGRVVWWAGAALMSRPLAGGAASEQAAITAPVRVLGRGASGAVVVAHDPAANSARLTRLDGGAMKDVPVEYSSTFAGAAFAYAPTSDRLLVGTRRALQLFKIGAQVEIAGRVEWNGDQLATVTGLADGVVYGEGGGITRIGPGDQRAAFTSPIGPPLHLAAGADRDHVWATSDDAVALLALAGGAATVVHKVAVPGVYHLASVDGAAAVLSVVMKGAAWQTLTLTVVGSDGAVRWQKVLSTPARQDATVAGGAGHVAVMLDGTPHVFKAADGAAVTP